MPGLQLTAVDAHGKVWRIGFAPNPWAWSGWEWATDGRFPGRWDDADGNFRTIYAGSTLLGCLLEVLARFRIDHVLETELEDIVEGDDDRTLYPSLGVGEVPYEWLSTRTVATAELAGTYCDVTTSESVAVLYPTFIGLALSLKLPDFDTAALKNSEPRELTQSVASFLYDSTDFDGVRFASRHGDDLKLWAVFEQAGDPNVTPKIRNISKYSVGPDSAEILQAFSVLGLRWADI